MNTFFKKFLILGTVVLAASFGATVVFAQSAILSNVSIDPDKKTLSVYVNETKTGKEIVLFFEDRDSGAGSEIDTLVWRKGEVLIGIQNFSITPPTVSGGGQSFNTLHVQPSDGPGEYFDLSQLFLGQGGGQSNPVTVNFPGWDTVETKFVEIPTLPGKFYPVIKSKGALVRTPASIPLYLVLSESMTEVRKVLESYPAGASSFRISWPKEVPTKDGGLKPDTGYEIYISTDEEGRIPVDFGTSNTTYMGLGSLPESGGQSGTALVSTTASVKKSPSGKNYYEISGTVNDETKNDTSINFVIRPKGAIEGGQLLGQVPYLKGRNFSVPSAFELDNFSSLENGEYVLVMNYTQPPRIIPQMIGDPLPLPAIGGEGQGGTVGQGGNTGGGGGAITPYMSEEQQRIKKDGIVPVECGHNIGKGEGGRMCGFVDIIKLIENGIQYIFILMLPITAIVFAYAGFLFLTSGGSPDKKTAAKKAMTNVIIGIIIVLAAFLIVKTLLISLGVDTSQDWVYLDI